MTKQSRVFGWVREVFTNKEANDVPERSLRMAEEALELAQACGVDVATLHRLVDYVMGRPAGKPAQEIAGTMVTLYALAGALEVDADAAFETELVRIQQPEVIDRCRRRQHEKREALSAPAYREEDRIDSVREALCSAIDQQIDRCGGVVSVRSLPDETVAEVFLKGLAQRGLSVMPASTSSKTRPDDFCDTQLGKTGALR